MGVGCWSCDFRVGDLFDYLKARHGCGFGEAVSIAAGLAAGGELPEVPDTVSRDEGPAPDFQQMVGGNAKVARGVVGLLLRNRHIDVPVDWLIREFRLRTEGHEVVIPHLDASGQCRGVKHRTTNGPPISVKGSKLDVLYGIWRCAGDGRDVVLCEGESDTWSVSCWLKDESVDVVGLPSGVGSAPYPGWIDWLHDRKVTILFDSDEAGRAGAARWSASLPSARVAVLPDGSDATSAGPIAIRQALRIAVAEDRDVR